MIEEIKENLTKLQEIKNDQNDEDKIVVFTSTSDRAFCAGGDIRSLSLSSSSFLLFLFIFIYLFLFIFIYFYLFIYLFIYLFFIVIFIYF